LTTNGLQRFTVNSESAYLNVDFNLFLAKKEGVSSQLSLKLKEVKLEFMQYQIDKKLSTLSNLSGT